MIRCATPDDIADLTRLIAEFRDWWGKTDPPGAQIRATLEALIADPSAEYLLAFDGDGDAVGVCQLRYRLSVWTGAEDCWLEDLFVSEGARGGGHGRELVERAFERARARGCKRIELDVNEPNVGALRFYESLGFTTEPKPPGRTLFVSRRL
jgi:ribosomal protein S18 acetylase RimI-like enzyme